MTPDLWVLMAAGLVIGGAAAWLTRRRHATPPPPAATARGAVDGLPTCEGLGPQREPRRD
jgi:hypothetical protein